MEAHGQEQTYPVVNVEEVIGKTVGRRKVNDPGRVQRLGGEIFRRAGFRICDPGVYRFHSHEEANEWMRQMAIKRAHLAAKA